MSDIPKEAEQIEVVRDRRIEVVPKGDHDAFVWNAATYCGQRPEIRDVFDSADLSGDGRRIQWKVGGDVVASRFVADAWAEASGNNEPLYPAGVRPPDHEGKTSVIRPRRDR